MWTNRGTAATLAVATLAGGALGQGLERQWISPSVGTSTQRFGAGLATRDGVLVMGAPFDDTAASNAGTAYVYRIDATTGSWTLEQQLFAKDAEANAQFGAAVAVDGDLLVVGAPLEDNTKGTDAGAVYVFRYDSTTSTWSEEQKVVASVGAASDDFGASLALSGDAFLAGAPLSDTSGGTDAGSAYVFRYKNSTVKWAEEIRLIDPDTLKGDQAGFAVALEGTRALVSSHLSDESTTLKDSGSVGVWELSGGVWSQTAEILQPTPVADSFFGYAVALDGNQLAIGSPAEDTSTTVTDSGAAYVFRLVSGSWTQEVRFAPPAPAKNGDFGNAVALRGKLLVIGSDLDDSSGKTDSGTNWTCRKGRKGWVLDQQLGASDAGTTDKLGGRVVVNATHILSAASLNDTSLGSDTGAVYAYPSAEIVTDITPTSPAADATVTFASFYGTPGDAVMLTIEDVAGTPVFIPVVIFVFAADRSFTFDAAAPNPLYGVPVGFRSYKVSETGPLVFSELEYVNL